MGIIPDEILAELEASGLPYTLENGGKHYKLKICGKLATIIPKGGKLRNQERFRRGLLNARAQVRRAIQERHDDVDTGAAATE